MLELDTGIGKKTFPENKQVKEWMMFFKKIPGVYFERIENAASNGTPDLIYFCGDVCGFIEFKTLTRKVEHGVGKIHHWTPTQRKWMKDRQAYPYLFIILRVAGFDYVIKASDMDKIENNKTWRIPSFCVDIKNAEKIGHTALSELLGIVDRKEKK